MNIQRLSESVIDQIAAGEVVERPASVVKELIENALDAGARSINVEVSSGGTKRIRVSDDGHGIRAAEVRLAFSRHATSKLRATQDLAELRTLGFRGEALATIAAVSQLSAITRHIDDELGTLVRIEGGAWRKQQSQAAPRGSMVTVENLFYNTPARLKFLKRPATERRQIARVVSRYVFAFPEARFAYQQDGRELFHTSGNGDRYDALVQLLGLSHARQLLPTPETNADRHPALRAAIQVSGFVSAPTLHRGDRNQLALYVNGRWIQDSRLNFAIIRAYEGLLAPGRFPFAFLQITMPPEHVDVNVHPTKAEVRFQQPERVFAAVLRAAQGALSQAELQSAASPANLSSFPETPDRWFHEAIDASGQDFPSALPATRETDYASEAEERQLPPRTLPPLRVVGQVGALYIVAEGPAGLYLIDQHAAHHRLLYEQLRNELDAGAIEPQELQETHTQQLPEPLANALTERLATLPPLGLRVEPFGPGSFALRALPRQCLLPHCEAESFLPALAAVVSVDEDDLLVSLSEQAAYREGQLLTLEMQQQLARALERCQSPLESPHGAPTLLHITREQLAREFHR